jgi:hypothetical protein
MICMKKISLTKLGLLLLAGSFLATGCVVRERTVYRQPAPAPAVVGGEVVVTEAPPPMVVENMTVSPGPQFVWVGGNWVWRNHWVWQRGRWERPPRAGVVWVPHRYEYRGGVHVFIRGGWR